MPESQNFLITELINDVKRGLVKIPQFQRDFIWSKQKAASLMDSILKGYPIGTLILWKTKETLRSIKNLGGINLPETPSGDFIQYVLDGQQRLTSIFATISGAIVRRDFKIEDFSEIYINLDANDDEEIVIPGKDGYDEKTLIKLTSLLYGGLEYLASFSKKYFQLLEKYKRSIETYPIPSILIREVSIDVATEIFTRINEGGKPLSVFEIMVAKTFDIEQNFDLSESYDELISNLSRIDYETISEATVLRSVSVILTKECSKKVILNLNKIDFIKNWQSAVCAIERAVEYFRSVFKISVSKILPYNDLIVIFAYFFHHHNEYPHGKTEQYLQDLFWRIALTERYSSSTETKIAQDIKRVDVILKGHLPDYNYSPYSKLTPEGIEQNGVFSVSRSFIKAILCLYVEQHPKSFVDNSIVKISNDWLKQANSKNYHFFFPKSYLTQIGVENAKINHIANVTIVEASLNKRAIGSKSPDKYIKKFSENSNLNETMETHLIKLNSYNVMTDDYETFFKMRINAISDALKKKIVVQTIDQINELLSTSDPEVINSIIEKIKKSKKKDSESENSNETENYFLKEKNTPNEIDNNSDVSEEAFELLESSTNQIDDILTVTKNKSSGKYFIYVEGDIDGNDTVINPFGKRIPFDIELFENFEDISLDDLLSENLINNDQLIEFKKHKKLEKFRSCVLHKERNFEKKFNAENKFNFIFRINKSFLENGYLTIPKEFNQSLMGTTVQHNSCDIHLISINGKQVKAYLYHGRSGWGKYFQIRIKDKPAFIDDAGFEGKTIGDNIQVTYEESIPLPKFRLSVCDQK